MENPQIVPGTTGNVTLTGTGATSDFSAWKITDASGTLIARGTSSNGTSQSSNGYSLTPGAVGNGTMAATVTLPAGATVQTGDVASFVLGSSTVFQGVFDVTPAPRPQVTAGGPAVAVTYDTSQGNASSSQAGIFDPSGTRVSTAYVDGNGQTVQTASQNGWTITANPDYATGTVQAPASAVVGAGYYAQIGESSGGGRVYFDVVAGSGTPSPAAPRRRPALLF